MSVETIAQEKSSRSSLVRKVGRGGALGLITIGTGFVGGFVGAVQGAFGSLTVPGSVRNGWNNRDEIKHDLFDKGWELKDKVANWAYHLPRVFVKFGGEGYILYKIGEDLVNGDGVSIGLLVIPNLINVYYELKRARGNYKLRNQEESEPKPI